MSGHITATHQPLVPVRHQTLVRMLVRDVLIGLGVLAGIYAAQILDGACLCPSW